ncbi:hypothetical protein SLA2020_093860 [Shorea laevis]
MGQPSSPGTDPVDLRDSIEELLKFTLHSHINGTLEFDLGLSKDFCISLLKDESSDPITGVPESPVRSRLATALHESIVSGAFFGTYCKLDSLNNESGLKQKEQWDELIRDKGSELKDILKTVTFELHVQEPYFTQLKDGLKTIEGRCAVGNYNRITSGAIILFNKCLVLEVQDIHQHASFLEMLETESLTKVLPGVKTVEEGVKVYRKFYTEEKEKSNGVLAIFVAKLACQPYLTLARILTGLSYAGIQNLLGRDH